MDDLYHKKYLKYKSKYIMLKQLNGTHGIIVPRKSTGGYPNVIYLKKYGFDDLFRFFISKVSVPVTLLYFNRRKPITALDNVNVLFTTFSKNFGVHIEDSPESNRFSMKTSLINQGSNSRIKFECKDPKKGEGNKNEKMWEIYCPGVTFN